MKKYYFSDNDEASNIEQNIEGADFQIMLDTCARYCTAFSIDIVDFSGRHFFQGIEALRRYENKDMTWEKYQSIWQYFEYHKAQNYCKRFYYQYNQETQAILKSYFSSLFSFPKANEFATIENLSFFRSDMTVFLCTETHEGDSFLYKKEKEDILCLLSMGIWKEMPITTIGYMMNRDMPWKDT